MSFNQGEYNERIYQWTSGLWERHAETTTTANSLSACEIDMHTIMKYHTNHIVIHSMRILRFYWFTAVSHFSMTIPVTE